MCTIVCVLPSLARKTQPNYLFLLLLHAQLELVNRSLLRFSFLQRICCLLSRLCRPRLSPSLCGAPPALCTTPAAPLRTLAAVEARRASSAFVSAARARASRVARERASSSIAAICCSSRASYVAWLNRRICQLCTNRSSSRAHRVRASGSASSFSNFSSFSACLPAL